MYTRSGYLFLMEKKAVLGTISWNKCYCHYRRDDGHGGRVFCMIPYNQVWNGKFNIIECNLILYFTYGCRYIHDDNIFFYQ